MEDDGTLKCEGSCHTRGNILCLSKLKGRHVFEFIIFLDYAKADLETFQHPIDLLDEARQLWYVSYYHSNLNWLIIK